MKEQGSEGRWGATGPTPVTKGVSSFLNTRTSCVCTCVYVYVPYVCMCVCAWRLDI